MRASNVTSAKYIFGICPDGSWSINLEGSPLTSGRTTASGAYALRASCVGSTLTLAANGVVVGHINDTNIASGGDYMDIYDNGSGYPVIVSDFTFTPLGH
jgi:hypothetical protein